MQKKLQPNRDNYMAELINNINYNIGWDTQVRYIYGPLLEYCINYKYLILYINY